MNSLASMHRVAFALVAWGVVKSANVAFAQSNVSASPNTPSNRSDFRVPDEFTGLIINQTITPLGDEFYHRFIEFWREKPQYDSYTVVVTERYSRRNGSQVGIIYRQRLVFNGILPIRYGLIKAFSNDAVEKAYTNIVSLSLRNSSDRDPDIAEDEF